MGITWGLMWAVAGVSVGVLSLAVPSIMSTPFLRAFDAPLPALALPGFFGGIFFSAVVGIAGRHRRFSELSLPKFTAWGAAGGFLLSTAPALLIVLRLMHPAAGIDGFGIMATVGLPFTLLGGASAAATLALARFAERRDAPAPVPLERP
jgi:hypothetical protein